MVIGRRRVASATWALVLVLAGCGGEARRVCGPAAPLADGATSETTVTSAAARKGARAISPSIAVSEEIARACNLHFNDIIAKAPKFEPDKSDLHPADREVLGTIGHCLSTGPLEGRSVKLVGRTDPRGTHEHNMALGARRANNVALFLEQIGGVERARLRETSRGELDATGKDEASWQVDRRVDILLMD